VVAIKEGKDYLLFSDCNLELWFVIFLVHTVNGFVLNYCVSLDRRGTVQNILEALLAADITIISYCVQRLQ